MKIVKSSREMREWSDNVHRNGETIAFVPTMGYFHGGHLSLMDIGKDLCSSLVVSIFVNPTQFGENEDLDAYPMDIEKDLKLAKEKGASAVFLPHRDEIYPKNYQSYVTLEHLPHHMCGLSRPVHFRGVATVVTKLFNIVKPDSAIFGSKDFQQLQIIKQLNIDLNFGINIVGAPIIRESDGLAMSSRNIYLKPGEREAALGLSKSRIKAKEMIHAGEKDAGVIKSRLKEFIESSGQAEVDYMSICDPDTLDEIEKIDQSVLFALAVHVGKARLIDNIVINAA